MKELDAERYYDILSLDWEYRKRTRYYHCSNCKYRWTPKHIRDTKCPKCGTDDVVFSPTETGYELTKTSKIQLPVLDNAGNTKGVPHYRLLYSNTDNAWSQRKTRDWVVVYAWFPEDQYRERNTYTVLTDGNGVRIIVGQVDPRDRNAPPAEILEKELGIQIAHPAVDLDEEISGDLETTEEDPRKKSAAWLASNL